MTERILRFVAVAIATFALVDPALTLSGAARQRVSVADSGGGADTVAVRRAIHDRLKEEFDAIVGVDTTAEAIVVVGNRYPSQRLPEQANVSTVTVGEGVGPFVVIRRIAAPRAVPQATTVRLGIDVEAAGKRGSATDLSVRANGALLARRTHTWTADAETWHEEVDVAPVGDAPPFLFDVRADDSQGSVAVDAAATHRVLVIESRPSWASAFVRRALEADPRFDVSGVSAPAPAKLVTSGESPALHQDLRRVDVIIVGGLDRLPGSDIDTLERFVRERGGALVFLPDGKFPSALAERFLPGVTLHETLLERPAALDVAAAPPLQASELLEAVEMPDGSSVVARSPSSQRPVVWTTPASEGRIVISGALDAWRYRGVGHDDFDRFWRSLISAAALSAQPAVDVTLVPASAAPGERVDVMARVRALERDQLRDQLAIRARVDDAFVRLWPGAKRGTFVGSFVADSRSASRTRRLIASIAGGESGSAPLIVAAQNSTAVIGAPPLSWLARTHHGVDVTPSTLDRLGDHLRRTVKPARVTAVRHPMRSPWWFVPFAGSLAGEWSLRRRRGAR
jgi:hypothetical protein